MHECIHLAGTETVRHRAVSKLFTVYLY